MNEALLIAIINLVTRVGFDAAIAVLTGMKSAATIDEAIAALRASREKTWADFKAEAVANVTIVPPPPTT